MVLYILGGNGEEGVFLLCGLKCDVASFYCPGYWSEKRQFGISGGSGKRIDNGYMDGMNDDGNVSVFLLLFHFLRIIDLINHFINKIDLLIIWKLKLLHLFFDC